MQATTRNRRDGLPAGLTYSHVGIPTRERFENEIRLEHLKLTVSDHAAMPRLRT